MDTLVEVVLGSSECHLFLYFLMMMLELIIFLQFVGSTIRDNICARLDFCSTITASKKRKVVSEVTNSEVIDIPEENRHDNSSQLSGMFLLL